MPQWLQELVEAIGRPQGCLRCSPQRRAALCLGAAWERRVSWSLLTRHVRRCPALPAQGRPRCQALPSSPSSLSRCTRNSALRPRSDTLGLALAPLWHPAPRKAGFKGSAVRGRRSSPPPAQPALGDRRGHRWQCDGRLACSPRGHSSRLAPSRRCLRACSHPLAPAVRACSVMTTSLSPRSSSPVTARRATCSASPVREGPMVQNGRDRVDAARRPCFAAPSPRPAQ